MILSRYGALIAHRSFRSFLFAGAFSLAGPTGTLVVLLFTVAEAFRGNPNHLAFAALALSFLGLSATIPTLVSALVSGTLADRMDRRRLMRWVNLLGLLATVALAIVLFERPGNHVPVPGVAGFFLPLWVILLYPFWAAITVATTLFRPAYNASLPRLVSTAELGVANGVIYAIAIQISIAVQLGSGATATALNPAWALAIPLFCYLAAQIALMEIDVDLAPRREGAPRRFLTDAKAGYRFLYRRKDLLEITIAALVINFLTAVALVELGLYVVDWLGLGAAIWVGVILAGASAGTGVGTLVIGRFNFERRVGHFLVVLTALQGVTIAILGLVRTIWLALPDAFFYGMIPGMFTVVFLSVIQATVPDAMMGRVFAADEVGSYALVPAGQYAGGLVTLFAGIQATYLIAGGGILAMSAVMAGLFSSMRRMGFQPQSGAAASSLPPVGAVNPAEARSQG